MMPDEPFTSFNMSDVRRAMPIVGGILILFGVLRRSPLSVLLAAAGGVLLYEGLRSASWNQASYEKGMPTLRTIPFGQGVRVECEVTVRRSPAELYQFWRNLENLPRVMSHLQEVRMINPIRSHWIAQAPAGMNVEWDAEIINDVPNERIGWRAVEGSDIPNAGSVQFTASPRGDGTVVHVNLKYDPPGGAFGAALAKLFGSAPSQTIDEDLHRFKVMMEKGEPAYI